MIFATRAIVRRTDGSTADSAASALTLLWAERPRMGPSNALECRDRRW